MAVEPIIARVSDDGALSLTATERSRLQGWAGKHVTIRPITRTRSIDQNSYWWAVPVRMIAEYCGYDPEQMHYALLGEWQGYADGPVGPPVPRCASSSKLTTVEFTALIEWVQRWAATELDLQIPSPGEWMRTNGE